MKKKLLKKVLLIVGASLLSIILLLGIVVAVLWHNEIKTVASIELIVEAKEENKSAPVYLMDVSGDYYFDKFIEEGGALDVLKTVGRRRWDSRNGESDANGITVWSALYDLTNKTAVWVSNEEFDTPSSVFTFDFSYLD